jgi:hypothetical protein
MAVCVLSIVSACSLYGQSEAELGDGTPSNPYHNPFQEVGKETRSGHQRPVVPDLERLRKVKGVRIEGESIDDRMERLKSEALEKCPDQLSDAIEACRQEYRNAIEATMAEFKGGSSPYASVNRMQLKMLDFDLRNEKDNTKRIDLLQTQVDHAKDIELFAMMNLMNGVGTTQEWRWAKATRLEIEIEIKKIEAAFQTVDEAGVGGTQIER